MLVLIVGVGIYLTIRTKFFQVTKIPTWWKNTIATVFKKGNKKAAGKGAVTPFQALTTALAATVGTGNIVGVSTAIVAGGPGAVFWMWISAFFGMMTKYSEITLSIKYRQRNAQGDWVGGPMYYIRDGLGGGIFAKILATLFAIFGALACFGIGNMTQVNSIASSLEGTAANFGLVAEATTEFSVFKLVVGIILAIACGLVIIGGLKRIASVTEKLVPFMCVLYILGGIVILCINFRQIGPAFAAIFEGAFSLQAFGGGALGYVMMQAIRFGVARGVFSNEAGLGSAPIAHAAADTKGPVQQGMWGVFEVCIDTIVICTFSALIVLTSGIPGVLSIHETPAWDGAQLTMQAFHESLGLVGSTFLSIGITLFAFSTVLSWSLYGQRCFEFLFKGKGMRIFQLVFIACIVVAAVMNLGLAWDIADTLNGLMAIPNLIGVALLSPVVIKLTKEYLAGRKKNSPLENKN